MTTLPYNDEAEWSVIAQMLTRVEAIPEVIGQQLELDDFFRPDCRLVFESIVEAYYADMPIDPVTIGNRLADPLGRQWECDPQEVAQRLYGQASPRAHLVNVTSHAKIIRDKAILRRLETLMDGVRHDLHNPEMTPEQLGERLTSEAAAITTGRKKRSEILSFKEVGQEYLRHLNVQRAARLQGIELAAYTGHKFVDLWTKGIAPTELMFVAGEPGVGKSAITWAMAEGFARRQLAKPADRRVSCLVLSLEMALVGSSVRLASSMANVEGERLREGDITDDELHRIMAKWTTLEGLPMYWNFASNFKASQMRALIVEGIRRHNVGLVILDHFRMWDPDRRVNNANQEDEVKARYLKEEIAKDLNVAVVCLAHTVKLPREDGRPRLADLRGSGQVAAHADIVAMMYRPWMYADEHDKESGEVEMEAAELIFVKNRNGAVGTSEFFFDPTHMDIRDN